jgi:hypothetical protein
MLRQPKKETKRERTQILNEFGRVCGELDKTRSLKERHEQLRKRIVGWYLNEDGDAEFEETTGGYVVTLSRKRPVRKVKDMRQLQEKLGDDVFYRIIEVPMTILDAHLPESVRSAFVAEDRIGPRTVKATPRMVQKKAA